MDPIVEGTLRTADGYWTVEAIRYGRARWYRVTHATTVVEERASLGTVQRILGDAMATLEPVQAEPGADGGIA
jgi:hypothetical protein